ncbi:MAG: LysR family transcriptional regulator [Anaerolineae bacterium]
MLNLNKLEIFAVAAQEGSFSKAGERLLMTQSAVSQHIHDLERGLGTDLFLRGRRGVTLTPAGETLFNYTQRILALIVEAENAVTQVENLAEGQVSVGATPGISVYLLPTWIHRFRRRYPNLTVSLQTAITAHITEQVLTNRLELGFVEGELEAEHPALGWRVLETMEWRVVVCQGSRWWNADSLTSTMLNGQPLIARQQNSQTRIWLDQLLAKHHITPQIVGEFDNPDTIKRATMSGLGMSILPEYAIQPELQTGLLRALRVDDLDLRRSLKMIWHQESPFRPITRAFIDIVTTAFPAQPA